VLQPGTVERDGPDELQIDGPLPLRAPVEPDLEVLRLDRQIPEGDALDLLPRKILRLAVGQLQVHPAHGPFSFRIRIGRTSSSKISSTSGHLGISPCTLNCQRNLLLPLLNVCIVSIGITTFTFPRRMS